MPTQTQQPDIILYDLACTKNVCFSPIVWRIRLMLNYKRIPYKTIFLEFQDIEPTLQQLGIEPHATENNKGVKYTVPAIHHVASGTYIMDSPAIAEFLEEKYPSPPVPLKSELGEKILADARNAAWFVFRNSLMPREVKILSPVAAEYFNRTREPVLGCKPEKLLMTPEQEGEAWKGVEEGLQKNGEMMRTNVREEGHGEWKFIEGERPGWTDFCIVGNMQCARVVHKGTFERLYAFEGYREVYDGCRQWVEMKKD